MAFNQFTPLSIAGCQLWLDSSALNVLYQSGTRAAPGTAVTANTNPIGLWLDSSGQNNDVTFTGTGTATAKPTWNSTAVASPVNTSLSAIPLGAPSFTSADSTHNSKGQSSSGFLASAFNTAYTVFCVAQGDAVNSPALMVSDTSQITYLARGGNSLQLQTVNTTPAGSGLLAYNAGGTLGIDIGRYDGTWKDIAHLDSDPANKVIRRLRSATTGSIGFSGGNIVIGGGNTTGFGYQGNICEVILYNAVLTDSQIAQVAQYLSNKWGVGAAAGEKILGAGNSLTFGYNPSGLEARWPGADWSAQLQGFLATFGQRWDFQNIGETGLTTTQLITNAAPAAATTNASFRVTRWFDMGRNTNVCTFWEITNDLTDTVNGVGNNPVAAFNNVVTYCQARQAEAYVVIVFTCLPRNDATTNFEQNRLDVNAAIRLLYKTGGTVTINGNTYTAAAGFATSLCDVGGDGTIGQTGQYANATYYTAADGIHLTPAGQAIVAGLAQAAIQGVLNFPILSGIGPQLYAPLRLTLQNGLNTMTVTPNDANATIFVTLSDTPPQGIASNLSLVGGIGVTMEFHAPNDPYNSSTRTVVARIVTPTGPTPVVAYDLTAADIAALGPGTPYQVGVTFTPINGVSHDFRGLGFKVVPVGSPNY